MSASGLILPDTTMKPGGILIGGKHARFQRRHGDIVASYQYVNGERAMALWPVIRKMRPGAFIVCDSAAWRYSPDHPRSEWYDEKGKLQCGPLYLMQQARVAAHVMGMDDTKPTIMRIASIIAEGLIDLVRLRPERPEDNQNHGRKAIGRATLLVNGKPVAEEDV